MRCVLNLSYLATAWKRMSGSFQKAGCSDPPHVRGFHLHNRPMASPRRFHAGGVHRHGMTLGVCFSVPSVPPRALNRHIAKADINHLPRPIKMPLCTLRALCEMMIIAISQTQTSTDIVNKPPSVHSACPVRANDNPTACPVRDNDYLTASPRRLHGRYRAHAMT
jgi:hypothetical protein